MASFARPSIIRQTAFSVPTKRLLSTAATPTPAFRAMQMVKPNSCSGLGSLTRQVLSARKPLATPIQIAAFHATAKNAILPALPQTIEGTVNDAHPLPPTSPTHGSYHWVFERAVSAALVPLTIAPFAAGTLNPVMDAILCGTILIHSHIGFQSIVIDYIPENRLPKTFKLFWWGLNAATLTVGVGLYEFETNDVGITEAVKRIWTA
ncbi:MAG: membrane anchor subunit of succinate dehydrogenase, Sdh4 [Cirrosporium novae-zelandiae]|nr:MAG: membrane anchor subunit of succinate dehydrogenase, Sdh4 [Cirrosporium novae-zelandiae]